MINVSLISRFSINKNVYINYIPEGSQNLQLELYNTERKKGHPNIHFGRFDIYIVYTAATQSVYSVHSKNTHNKQYYSQSHTLYIPV